MMIAIRDYLEMVYFGSGIVTACAAMYGLKQIRVLKRDISVRNERAAKEKAIDYCGRYLNGFIPLIDKFSTALRLRGCQGYSGPFGDFSPESIPKGQLGSTMKRFQI
jgi:hypothetical protein